MSLMKLMSYVCVFTFSKSQAELRDKIDILAEGNAKVEI